MEGEVWIKNADYVCNHYQEDHSHKFICTLVEHIAMLCGMDPQNRNYH